MVPSLRNLDLKKNIKLLLKTILLESRTEQQGRNYVTVYTQYNISFPPLKIRICFF